MREVLTAYQNYCAEFVRPFEGYVAKLMGDGVLVYFGWPAAHEDDAERAVLAGLEVVAAVAALNSMPRYLTVSRFSCRRDATVAPGTADAMIEWRCFDLEAQLSGGALTPDLGAARFWPRARA